MQRAASTAFTLTVLVSLTLLVCGSASAETEVFSVSIVNDTASNVVVHDCADFCSSSPLTLNLQSGSRAPINRVAGAHKYFSVTTVGGARLGCVDLYFAAPSPGASVPISRARPCPGPGRTSRGAIGLGILVALTIAVVVYRRRRSGSQRSSSQRNSSQRNSSQLNP